MLLALILGPFGLMYVSVLGGVAMLLGLAWAAISVQMAGPFIIWSTCVIWAWTGIELHDVA